MRVALLVVLAACGGPQLAEHPKAEVTNNLPATLEAAHPKEGEPRTVHVRVLADTGARAQPRWKEDINDEVDYASQLLTPLLGVRLTVDAIKEWDHVGSDARSALNQLVQVDDAKDVTWVIGFITSADGSSKAMIELGAADVLGHHVTLRTWAEKAETDALATKLPDLSQAQRAEVISAHKRHKQAVVLLHLLAQTLGAIDEADPSWIQHPAYSSKQSTFSERNRDLMQLAIDARLSSGTDQSIAHDLIEAIEKSEWGGWVPTDHDEVVKTLRNVVDSGKAGKTAADVPTAAYEQFDRIRELVKKNPDEARIELDNLMVAYPGNAAMQELKCELLLAKPGLADKATRAACSRVSELAPADPAPHLAVGEALARASDATGARTELAQAAIKIANLKTSQDESWKKLVAIYQAMGALTWTEEALAAGKLDKDPASAEIAQTRARYGVPRNTKLVRPDGEGALVAAVKAAFALVNANKLGEAQSAITVGEKKWPGAAGFEAARCDLALRQEQVDVARAACQRALAVDPDESWALYLGGVIELKDVSNAGTRAGIEKLKHAIAVDPELAQAWRALGKAYTRAKDRTAHDELDKQYQTKFGRALP
jgi:predicted Zn-dependent protease